MEREMMPTERELRKRLAKMMAQMDVHDFVRLYAFAKKLVLDKQKR